MKHQRIRNVKQFLAKRERDMWDREYARDAVLRPMTGWDLYMLAKYQHNLMDIITNPVTKARILNAAELLQDIIRKGAPGTRTHV